MEPIFDSLSVVVENLNILKEGAGGKESHYADMIESRVSNIKIKVLMDSCYIMIPYISKSEEVLARATENNIVSMRKETHDLLEKVSYV